MSDDEVTGVDWDRLSEYAEQLDAAGPLVREAERGMREAWNQLLFDLARLANPEHGYDGETADELVEKLRRRLESRPVSGGLFLKFRPQTRAEDVANTVDVGEGVMLDVDVDGVPLAITIVAPAYERIDWLGGVDADSRAADG